MRSCGRRAFTSTPAARRRCSPRAPLGRGVTDAAVIREFGWIWAGDDMDKQAFVDALSIVPMGTKVGPWAVRLLATKDHELCSRIAVLRDSDLTFEETPMRPAWGKEHYDDVLLVTHSHPTLEPELTLGNESSSHRLWKRSTSTPLARSRPRRSTYSFAALGNRETAHPRPPARPRAAKASSHSPWQDSSVTTPKSAPSERACTSLGDPRLPLRDSATANRRRRDRT